MSDPNGTTAPGNTQANPSTSPVETKGKGKAVDPAPQDLNMEDDDDSSEEETGAEEDAPEAEEEDEDEMGEIDTQNILNTGRRTRGKTIDFAAVTEEAADELDDDEDDDEDFEGDEDEDAMQE